MSLEHDTPVSLEHLCLRDTLVSLEDSPVSLEYFVVSFESPSPNTFLCLGNVTLFVSLPLFICLFVCFVFVFSIELCLLT